MLADRNEIAKMLRSLSAFDGAASPFVGMTFEPSGALSWERRGFFGTIESRNHSKLAELWVSLNHFQDCLRVLNDESVELTLDSNGVLCLTSTNAAYSSELRVHTVPPEKAGLKSHDVGNVKVRLPAEVFAGFDSRPFKLAAQPILAKGRLMLPSNAGIIFWNAPEGLKNIEVSPRETFLHFASSNDVEDFFITEKGYWGVSTRNLLSTVAAHSSNRSLFDAYQLTGTKVEEFPAHRLLYALDAAAKLSDDPSSKVEWDPAEGILTRDRFGNPARFSLGATYSWPKFNIMARTAKLIGDALSQSEEEEATLLRTNMGLCLKRGAWEVNFKGF